MTRLLTFLAALIAILAAPAHATPCDHADRDRAAWFADLAGRKFVDDLGGGQDIRVTLNNCDFNTYARRYRLEVAIRWNGSVLRSNRYLSEGTLTFDRTHGASAEYAESYANPTLSDWRKTLFILVPTIVVLGTLASESN